MVYRMYVSVSEGGWPVSARTVVGVAVSHRTPPDVARRLFEDVLSPSGTRYKLVRPSAKSDALTFLAETSSVLLDGPIPWTAVPYFETSLETAIKPFLGKLKLFFMSI